MLAAVSIDTVLVGCTDTTLHVVADVTGPHFAVNIAFAFTSAANERTGICALKSFPIAVEVVPKVNLQASVWIATPGIPLPCEATDMRMDVDIEIENESAPDAGEGAVFQPLPTNLHTPL
jgi:hypothetical protein